VRELRGALVVRLPRETGRVELPAELGAEAPLPGGRIALAELGRDRFVLRAERGGERVLAVRAFNASGAELWVLDATPERTPAGWRAELQVKGVPARIEVVFASELESGRFAFALAP
jgi:hypothetical protein